MLRKVHEQGATADNSSKRGASGKSAAGWARRGKTQEHVSTALVEGNEEAPAACSLD